MQPIPYLFFNGNCEEVIRAYQRVFGSPEPQIMRNGEVPDGQGMGGDAQGVMHAALKVGDGWIYASDHPQARPMAGSSVAVTLPDAEASRRVFNALAEGGSVDMPFGATFWSRGFGGVTDRWGTSWMVDTEGAPTAEDASREPAGASA